MHVYIAEKNPSLVGRHAALWKVNQIESNAGDNFGKQITVDLRKSKLGHAWFWEANQRKIMEKIDGENNQARSRLKKEENFLYFGKESTLIWEAKFELLTP